MAMGMVATPIVVTIITAVITEGGDITGVDIYRN
jgi:hypothetical protein